METGRNTVSEEEVAEAKEKYDDLAEEFLDTVFDVESILQQHEWEATVAKHC